MTRRTLITTVASLAAGVLLGTVAGKLLFSPGTADPESSPGSPVSSTPSVEPLTSAADATTIYDSLSRLETPGIVQAIRRLVSTGSSANPVRERVELDRILAELARDPLVAHELINTLKANADPNRFRRTVSIIFSQWALTDPKSAAEALDSLSRYYLQNQAMHGVLKAWAKSDPEAALAFAEGESAPALMKKTGPEIILEALAKTEPQRAVDLARETGTEALERRLYQTVVSTMLKTDVDEALAWIERVEDPELQQQLRNNAITEISWKDRPKALDIAITSLHGDEKVFKVREIFNQWAVSNGEEAAEVFVGFPKEHLDEGAIFAFGQAMNLSDPAKALALSESLTGDTRTNYLRGVLTEQAIKQPAATAEHAGQYLADENHLGQIYEHLAGSWAGKDEHAAAQWLSDLPVSPARDRAVGAFSRKLFATDPERAVQWAASITDSDRRNQSLGKLVEKWMSADAAAAEAWLSQTATISDAEKATFRTPDLDGDSK